jgi:hypothetical protein
MSDDSQNSIFRKESLERLSSPEQLDQLMQVVSPRSWLPLTALGCLVGFALLWSIFGRIPITATGQGVAVHPSSDSKALVSLNYFAAADGNRIQPGMQIIIVPNTTGTLNGIPSQVKSVSQPSVTTLEAVHQAQNSNLIQADMIEVLTDISTSDALTPGTPTTARIVLEQKPPIAFVLPFWRN